MDTRLTVAEVAVQSRRHPVTIYRALEEQRLHGVQEVKGGKWLVRASCLDAWLDREPCMHQAAKSNVRHLVKRGA